VFGSWRRGLSDISLSARVEKTVAFLLLPLLHVRVE
jgi:hypothetical protein